LLAELTVVAMVFCSLMAAAVEVPAASLQPHLCDYLMPVKCPFAVVAKQLVADVELEAADVWMS
jgi:hypothetical protein